MYTDSHCHLDFSGLREQLPEVLQRMMLARVTRALCVSVTLEDFPQVLALTQRNSVSDHSKLAILNEPGPFGEPQLYASVGVHPDYPDCEEPSVETPVPVPYTHLTLPTTFRCYFLMEAGC